ncbi:hypothetical protein SDRG_16481 [Saprolegnia diclina VS20]|uniref:START domain-containing protein n=1 Tax=Saprolegnia diclina (strain VS20) TaxID=1156394 RepID=T0PXA3_SAPDV|nr:hypothetical protein SDRG_16481 [Saprolegnia diclina VS20]EQC25660.1 hypothetical protein SDRG_16481 [Saprolegnia diclina VS20]|eukprot:XP_008620917.1 hypothetical protein SDRG_16481 [Saprolegnia diclina VS20]
MLSTISQLHAAQAWREGYTDETIDHVKSKRVHELHQLKRYIHELEATVVRIKRQKTSVLPWEDVAKALADDTLDRVQCNMRLRGECDYNRRVCQFLKDWVDSMVPPPLTPGLTKDTWRHATIFAGDVATRQVGYTWLTRQVYANTDRALARLTFPEDAPDALHVDVDHRDVDDTIHIEIHQQTIWPFAYDDVVAACAIANKTFVQTVQARSDCVEALTPVDDDITYVQEEMGHPDRQAIFGNVLYGTFAANARRAIMVKRSIIKDEAHPIASSVWTLDSKGWLVVEPLPDGRSRVRMLDVVGHPCSARGFVPILDLAAMLQLRPRNVDDAVRLMRQRFVMGQAHQAKQFKNLVQTLLVERLRQRPDSAEHII